jgi:hypothetical protein
MTFEFFTSYTPLQTFMLLTALVINIIVLRVLIIERKAIPLTQEELENSVDTLWKTYRKN